MVGALVYLAGVLSIPAAILAWVAFKFVLLGTSKAAEALLVRIPDRPSNRALAGAMVLAGKRTWFLSVGEVAVALTVGQDVEARRAAGELLNPPFSLRGITKTEVPDD